MPCHKYCYMYINHIQLVVKSLTTKIMYTRINTDTLSYHIVFEKSKLTQIHFSFKILYHVS